MDNDDDFMISDSIVVCVIICITILTIVFCGDPDIVDGIIAALIKK